jgi:hypothetical protein
LLSKLKREHIAGLILDLRRNGGASALLQELPGNRQRVHVVRDVLEDVEADDGVEPCGEHVRIRAILDPVRQDGHVQVLAETPREIFPVGLKRLQAGDLLGIQQELGDVARPRADFKHGRAQKVPHH